jgi:BirA family biotin operon repressor/biotin-[acetyl-CoA-carboxylase] ligase
MTAPGPTDSSPAERWPDALEAALARTRGALSRCVVLRETASTQDHARAAGIEPGTVVVAWRQTAGRGRLGRAWADTGTDGVAATFALPAAPPESLAMRSAVAAASAARRFLAGDACGVKWPNDVVVDGRKLAGVLVERIDGTALVGIGINVRQTSFPPPLDGHATSLAMHGPAPDRLDVLAALFEEIGIAFAADAADFERSDSDSLENSLAEHDEEALISARLKAELAAARAERDTWAARWAAVDGKRARCLEELLSLKGAIRVMARVRPPFGAEAAPAHPQHLPAPLEHRAGCDGRGGGAREVQEGAGRQGHPGETNPQAGLALLETRPCPPSCGRVQQSGTPSTQKWQTF